MDHEILVEEQIEEGRRLIERIAAEALTISVAAWIKRQESRYWTIYIAVISPLINIRAESTRIALHALENLGNSSILLIDINIIEANSPVGVDLLAIRAKYPSMVGTKLRTRRKIGQLETRGLYLYPANYWLSGSNQIVHSVLQLLDRSGSAAPSVFTFKDGSQIHAVPVGIRLNTPDGARIDWHDVVTSQDRSVAADQVVSIH